MTPQQEFDFSIVSASLTIEAMRNSGYKDTDHALAELIDNSVEAKADMIDVIAVETPPDPGQRYARYKVTEIAVADNGDGMDLVTLRRALKIGDGTRLDRMNRGIGRFGVGLPQSSISQCKRVDVWSWKTGPENAVHCYLDINEIKNQGRSIVPEVSAVAVPDKWRSITGITSEPKGTLVVWSELDRVKWSGGEKTLERTAELCGRIYRKFLTNETNRVSLNLIRAINRNGTLNSEGNPRQCHPNDPLYLTNNSSTPAPFNIRPMFERFNEHTWKVPLGNSQDDIHSEIRVVCSLARLDAINQTKSTIPWPDTYRNPGDTPWGKHADRNKGVSIVRAGRELEMSLAWVNNYDPTERWWSVEVEFDPILDELFGVVNNKQHAHAFVNGAGFDWKMHAVEGETYDQFLERLQETEDGTHHLIGVWNWIDEQIKNMRKERKKRITKSQKSRHPHPETGEEAVDVATKTVNKQAKEGEKGATDNAPKTTPEEKIELITESAKQKRVDDSTAKEWAEEVVRNNRRFLMKAVTLGHEDAFFTVESANDVIEVWFNNDHMVYQNLIEVLSQDFEGATEDQLIDRLKNASFTLSMLLMAWARYEDKTPKGLECTLGDMRMDWGREARKFLGSSDS